jgi:hypothetical protein
MPRVDLKVEGLHEVPSESFARGNMHKVDCENNENMYRQQTQVLQDQVP